MKKIICTLLLSVGFLCADGLFFTAKADEKDADVKGDYLSSTEDEKTDSSTATKVSTAESDDNAMNITDEWLASDTENAVKAILEKWKTHKGFQKYLIKLGHEPKMFIAEVVNRTSEASFPIDDLNDEFLNEVSDSGDFTLINAKARDKILKEIRYRNDGMIKASDIKKIGRRTGAELLMIGVVRMNPKTLNGKTIKEYAVNVRLLDIETGDEVGRFRQIVSKYPKRGGPDR